MAQEARQRGPVKGPMGGPGRGMRGPKIENAGEIFRRLLGYVMKNYAVYCVIVVICIVASVLASVQGTLFMKTLIDGYIKPLLEEVSPDFTGLFHAILRVAGFLLLMASYFSRISCTVISRTSLLYFHTNYSMTASQSCYNWPCAYARPKKQL